MAGDPGRRSPSDGGAAREFARRTLIAGVILAGGAAQRLGGGDKPLLTVGRETILARIVTAMGLEQVAINANGDPARFSVFGRPVLNDGTFGGQGPLAGVLAALDWAATIGATAVLTVPGDTPLIPAGLPAALAPPPACAASRGRVHHLIALWPTAAREALRAHLSRPGSRHVVRFAEAIGMRSVDFPADAWDPFLNVNTPDDLAAAHALATSLDRGAPAKGAA